MHRSRRADFINPIFENDIQKSTSVESLRLQKQTTNRTEEGTGHSGGNSWNQSKPLNSEKAKPAQRSIRALLALVIIVCLISLVALLLTLLMLSGKIGSANEASYSASAKAPQTDLANIKALEVNLTSLQLALVDGIDSQLHQLKSALNRTNSDLAQLSNTQTEVKSLESAVTQLKFALNRSDTDHAEQLNNTQTKLEKLDSALNQLKSASNRTSNDLAELNSTQTKLEDLDSALNQLKSALNRTNNDLAELNSTQTKGLNPSAHIVASYLKTRSYSANTVIKDWSTSDPHSHLDGGMKYEDGKLAVPRTGRYYIYAHFVFVSKGRIELRVNDDYVTLISSLGLQASPNGFGVFVLNAGDTISLRINPWEVPHDGLVRVWMQYNHCYFGAFLI